MECTAHRSLRLRHSTVRCTDAVERLPKELRGFPQPGAARNGDRMSQRGVERVIGQLATDEGLRRQFQKDPRAAVQALVERGLELNECERASLLCLDAREIARFARAIDPRLQRIESHGGEPWPL